MEFRDFFRDLDGRRHVQLVLDLPHWLRDLKLLEEHLAAVRGGLGERRRNFGNGRTRLLVRLFWRLDFHRVSVPARQGAARLPNPDSTAAPAAASSTSPALAPPARMSMWTAAHVGLPRGLVFSHHG